MRSAGSASTHEEGPGGDKVVGVHDERARLKTRSEHLARFRFTEIYTENSNFDEKAFEIHKHVNLF